MILDRVRNSIANIIAPPAASPTRGQPQAQYMKGGATPFFFNWHPALRDQRDDVMQAYMTAASRAVDAIHNSGWLTGAITQAIAATMGEELRLASKPDAKQLGWTQGEADVWSSDVERAWRGYSRNPGECDAGERMTVGQQCRAVMKSYYSHGEGLALLPKIGPRGRKRTKVKLIPAHKLLQDSDGWRMFQGVTMDGWGKPLSYRMSLRVMQAYEEIVDINARDGVGRPQVVHVFDPDVDTVRGLTPIAPVLKITRQYDQLSDATLTAGIIQSIFAATVESDAPTDTILQALQDDEEQGVGGGTMDGLLGAKAAWYDSTKIDLGRAGKIAHLFPGEKLTFNGAKTPNDTYEAFAKFLLREIARCLGLTFETLTGDYTAATYSSVRMSAADLWPVTLTRRAMIPGRFAQLVYEAWLEERIELGLTPFPGGLRGFLENRTAAVAADWRGPPKPQADDLKTAKAHQVYKSLGVVSDDMICNDLGVDVEDVYRQRAHEMAMRKELKLPEGDAMAPPADPEADALLQEKE